MTKDELRLLTFKRIMCFIGDMWVEKQLQNALDQSHGDVDKALQYLIDNTDAPLIQGGSCGDVIQWELFTGYRGSGGEAWIPPHHSWNSPPDITFGYRDLLVWLSEGKPENVQLEMF